jgi:DNA-damage-inducible protein D
MVGIGSEASREVPDYHLSRFACYLIAQNGDPRKAEIAAAQKYFAIQTRRQELSDQLAADVERLELRRQTSEEFKALSGAAREAGVHSRMFGVFHDAGSNGLYGGLGRGSRWPPDRPRRPHRCGVRPSSAGLPRRAWSV